MQGARTWFVLILLAVTLPVEGAPSAAGSIERGYSIHRDGSKIGTRTLRITWNGQNLEVVNETNIAVGVLFVTLFKRHENMRELWRGGRLVEFFSQVNNDGEQFKVKGTRTSEGTIRVEGSAGNYIAPKGTLPATYWHEGITKTETLIHVMRGRLQKVSTTRVGPEFLTVGKERVKTTRYRMTGDERVDLWFGDGRLIIRALYHNEDGSKVDIRANDPAGAAADSLGQALD